MELKYFGTDGIRGVVDKKITHELCYGVGVSLAKFILKHKLPKKVIIGKDTRISGDMLAATLCSALLNYGVDVVLVGVVPTGCVSYLTSKQRIAFGVMITASHNAPDMNGFKIINNMGYKIDKSIELEIEKIVDLRAHKDYMKINMPTSNKGALLNGDYLIEQYTNHLIEIGNSLKGVSIAVDCANGSNYKIAPQVYRALGAEVVEINTNNNGNLINVNSGALHPETLKNEVINHKCDIGFAFDGDADRLIAVTNKGRLLNGDDLLYLFSEYMHQKNQLNSLAVVGTVMTNMGCEKALNDLGLELVRVDVGDKNIINKMREENYSLGGESSGHICIHKYGTTCDALLNSLQLLNLINLNFNALDEKLLRVKKYDSELLNIQVSDEFRGGFNKNTEFKRELSKIIKKYKDVKIVVRPSGTESLIRVLVEGENALENNSAMKEVEKTINAHMVEVDNE